jgi:uncharacterized membrane protein YtjA (UPF0391 family)
MLTLGLVLLGFAIITAVFGFGVLSSPYVGTFRIAFYLFVILFVVVMVVGVQQSYYGYDPTPQGP